MRLRAAPLPPSRPSPEAARACTHTMRCATESAKTWEWVRTGVCDLMTELGVPRAASVELERLCFDECGEMGTAYRFLCVRAVEAIEERMVEGKRDEAAGWWVSEVGQAVRTRADDVADDGDAGRMDSVDDQIARCLERGAESGSPPRRGEGRGKKGLAIRCRYCGTTDVACEQRQTRGADEGMSTFAYCLNKKCENHQRKWRV